MSWLLNRMFTVTSNFQRLYWRNYMASHNSIRGAQTLLY